MPLPCTIGSPMLPGGFLAVAGAGAGFAILTECSVSCISLAGHMFAAVMN
jgi:hypothetical protein